MTTNKINKVPSLKLLSGKFEYKADIPHHRIGFNDPKYGLLDSPNNVWHLNEINSFIKSHLDEFKKNVFIISNSFKNAVKKSAEAFNKAIQTDAEFIFENLKYPTGILIDNEDGAIFFHINKKDQSYSGLIFDGEELVVGYKNLKYNKNSELIPQGYLPNYMGNQGSKHAGQYFNAGKSLLQSAIQYTLVRSYADHEVKIITSKSTGKLNNIQYNNLNNMEILVLDSSWYTSIINTVGFGVRGHFRFQACGKGHADRKLIYVDAFQKHGYVRKAKMLPTEVPSISQIV